MEMGDVSGPKVANYSLDEGAARQFAAQLRSDLTLPSDTTAAPAISTTVRLGDGRDELVGDSSTRQPATSTTIPPNPGDAVSCADFDNHAAAQEWYDTYWPHYGDIALIDINNNGVACEKLLTEAERATTTTRRTTDGNAP